VWLLNLARGTRSRLTHTSNGMAAVWSPDGRALIYASGGAFFRKPIGGGAEQRLPGVDTGGLPLSWSPDGQLLLFDRNSSRLEADIFTRKIAEAAEPTAIVATAASERWAQYSPSGKWIAYTSDESGRREVYVVRTGASDRWQISTDGGNYPRWGRDGSELFFWNPTTEKIMAARLSDTANGVDVTSVTPLFTARVPEGFGRFFFDVGPDGRFLMEVPTSTGTETKLSLAVNWPSLLSTTK
jgi:Tol biopolymer transport system component